jgi:outer membrane protein OmpA-like peptidoglycan-associated protein
MRSITSHRLAILVFALTVLAVPVFGTSGVARIDPAGTTVQGIPEGKKAKIKGVVTTRTTDGFILKDAKFVETTVVLTDSVRLLLDGKEVTQQQRAEIAKLVGGIIATVEGYGNASGQLVAEKISISNKDVRSAQAVASKLAPVEARVTTVEKRAKRLEAQQEALAAEVAELDELTRIATEEAARANERISALDNYTVKDSATVTFAVNRAILTPEAKAALDDLVAKSTGMKATAYEITGYTDTTGNAERNRVLSEKRANAVITYLTDTHNIPLRRIVTPLGYGQARPIADNSTPEGRAQNRRVEVKLMQQGGIS